MEDIFEILFEGLGEIFVETYIALYTNLLSAIFPNHRGRKWIEIVGVILGLLMFFGTLALCFWGIACFFKRQFLKGLIIIAGMILIFVIHVLVNRRLDRRNA
ncbi:MAG: hypothetical protein IJA86_08790 [Clostridia bacterium]|nr:hypothetical protein [Clostridia bacterium]